MPDTSCPSCGYDLAIPAGGSLARCPECGAATQSDQARRWYLQLVSLSLHLVLWALPVMAFAWTANFHRIASITMNDAAASWNAQGSLSIDQPVLIPIKEGAKLAIGVAACILLMVQTPDGLRRRLMLSMLILGALSCLIDLASVLLPPGFGSLPWYWFGARPNGLVDQVWWWGKEAVIPLVGGVLTWLVALAARTVSLPKICGAGTRLAVLVALAPVAISVIRWLVSATNWADVSRLLMFSSPAVSAALLVAVWTLALVVRARVRLLLTHGTVVESRK